MNTTLC